jgi:hypothetical protein
MARVLRHELDDDLDDYDPRYFPRKVFKDGRGPRVHLMLTDAASRRVPLMDARAREHQCLLDGYARIGAAAAAGTAGHRPGQVSLSDAMVRNARSKSEHARAEWVRKLKDMWRDGPVGGIPRKPPSNGDGNRNGGAYGTIGGVFGNGNGKGDDEDIRSWRGAVSSGPSPSDNHGGYEPSESDILDPGDPPEGVSAADLARARWIDRMSRDWQRGVPPVWTGASPGATPGGAQYPAPTGPARSDYAESAWSAQRAIRPGDPGAADQIERYRRRLSGEASDAASDTRQAAYDAYVARITSDWRK